MRHRPPQGFSLFALVFGGLFIAAGGLAAFKIGMPYGDARVLKGIVEVVLTESKSDLTLTNYDIAKKIFDRANVQTLHLDFEGIQVKTVNSGEFAVHIDMVTKIALWKQANLILDLPVDGQTK